VTRSTNPTTRAAIPTRTQEVIILPGDTVTGAPLVLGFQGIFLRPAIAPESDVIFSKEDLVSWAKDFWDAE